MSLKTDNALDINKVNASVIVHVDIIIMIFNQIVVSNFAPVCFRFRLLRTVIRSQNSRHFLNQRQAKQKPIRDLLARVSSAWQRNHVFPYWFIVWLAFFVIG